ncbi:MAG: sensor histidine kinase [Streptosporangiaceae bacterium]|nr:sensor histidine kinase [Streptosporangiaceae bacterium]
MMTEGGGFSHAALLYRGQGEYLSAVDAVLRFSEGVAAPLHVAVPAMTGRLTGEAVRLTPRLRADDMTDLGGNPARIIPAAQAFADDHAGTGVYCLWEPAWPARSAAELREVARHEALVNLAFRDQNMTILCLYDAAGLGDGVIRNAEYTHPLLSKGGSPLCPSAAYLGPGRLPPGCDEPLPPAAADAEPLAFGADISGVREFAARHARAAGLDSGRVSDLVIAVSEIAGNALDHGGGVIRAWCPGGELICQVEDAGHITDPLAGRRRPPDAPSGHGLWLVNQLCDLVETRTGPAGTTTRIHMRCRGE